MEKPTTHNDYPIGKIVDLLVRLGVLLLLLGWCVNILRPFVLIIIWAAVIAIAIYPMHQFLANKLRLRKILSAILLTLVLLSVLILPAFLLAQSLAMELDHLRGLYQSGQPVIPMPGPSTEKWPAIFKPIIDIWKLASENLQAAALQYSEQLKTAGAWFLKLLAGIGMGVLQFLGSIILAGVFLAFASPTHQGFSKIFYRLAGDEGKNYLDITVSTVRSVVKGILGVAVIQAAMAALGFFIAGVPYAGLWTVLVLVLAVVQVGAGPVCIPIIIYMFSVADTMTATLLAIWLGLTLVIDNVLKPILLGRGAAVPMLVVFLGAIGGFIASGFLGLFLGAVVLTIGYKLFIGWLDGNHMDKIAAESRNPSPASAGSPL